jgi:DNA replication protein DnaC
VVRTNIIKNSQPQQKNERVRERERRKLFSYDQQTKVLCRDFNFYFLPSLNRNFRALVNEKLFDFQHEITARKVLLSSSLSSPRWNLQMGISKIYTASTL